LKESKKVLPFDTGGGYIGLDLKITHSFCVVFCTHTLFLNEKVKRIENT
jgi:hypothetical protein